MGIDKKIQIIMSTYNGEKYLREQLDSIINLDGYDLIKVLIRDDGSTDNTLSILEEYSNRYGFEIIKGNNVGVNKSLFLLFEACDKTCDYFAISDQDDVWVKDKIQRALYELKNMDSNKPSLFATVSCITDEKLNPIKITSLPKKGPSFYNAMIQNIASGHTQVFNRKLLEEIMNCGGSSDIVIIDWWIYLVASAIGEVIVSDQYTVLHRQHENNAIGHKVGFFKQTYSRLVRLFCKHDINLSVQLKDFLFRYENKMKKEYIDEIKRNLSCERNLVTRVYYCFRSKVYRENLVETLCYKILYLLGRYKI